jgi:hypothetical protein
MRMELTDRFGYGQHARSITRPRGAGLAVSDPDALRLSTPVETREVGIGQTADFTVSEGEQVPFVLTRQQNAQAGRAYPPATLASASPR